MRRLDCSTHCQTQRDINPSANLTPSVCAFSERGSSVTPTWWPRPKPPLGCTSAL